MSFNLQVLVLLAAAAAGSCGINRMENRQQRALEAQCHCLCTRADTNDPATFQQWAQGDQTLTMAWGGGFWRCGR